MYKDNYFSVRLAGVICVLAWVVILLGAYARLKDAGLGCPDWPLCYGQLSVPQTQDQLKAAKAAYPQQPVEAAKAWPEMVHRYFVGALGSFILLLGMIAYRQRRRDNTVFLLWLTTIAVVLFQALLGKWTVTWKLLPTVVMGHLVGGFTLLALLWLIFLHINDAGKPPITHHAISLKPWAIVGLILVILQIMLGGWTSANYAALICPDFPRCHGQWIPSLSLSSAFHFLTPIGQNFQGGVLSESARMTIQFFHRLGALLVFFYVSGLSVCCLLTKISRLRRLGAVLLILLITQVILGICNIELLLPIGIAVAHNGVAALLLLGMVTLLYALRTD